MAAPKTGLNGKIVNRVKKRTSIGKSIFSRPKNKNKRSNWKPYRGQGK